MVIRLIQDLSGRGAAIVPAATSLLYGCLLSASLSLAGSSAAALTPVDQPIDSYIVAWRGGTLAAPRLSETSIHVPMPPGFRVINSELEGPVFADSLGETLYIWPRRNLENGAAGDNKGQSECTSVKTTVNSGFMSPYPPGLQLPDLDQRPSCTQVWPLVVAHPDAKPIGTWTIITRKDGIRQWAYDGYPLYTSALDRQPGDALGGTSRRPHAWVMRKLIGPPPDVPPGFKVVSTALGRLLVTAENHSVYVSDADTPHRSNCDPQCLKIWIPLAAPDIARPRGEWSIIERAPGVRQWAFRKRPLYRYVRDYSHAFSLKGSDEPGWHNVFTQMTPPPPREFTVQDTTTGQVLADAHGMTIYVYQCGDDALDQLGCDHPTETQAYRLAMCGGGDPARCLRTFPYVLAPSSAPRGSAAWRAIDIDPMTGRLVRPGAPGTLHIWAYRDRPVYTYAGDKVPGDINADSHGEYFGQREGFKAFWLRDDYYGYND